MIEYRLADLLDIGSIQKMADSQYQATGMPLGIIDALDGTILFGCGWQDICVRFHRANPLSSRRCQESDRYIHEHLVEGQACAYKCQNGLTDIGVPILVAGKHLATLFLGQFFYEDEKPDRDFFVRQAVDFGYNQEDYLAALDRVPYFTREKVDYILQYNLTLSAFISALAEQSLHRIHSEQKICESERKFHAIFDNANHLLGMLSPAGQLLEVSRTALLFCGVTEQAVVGRMVWDTPWWSHSAELQERLRSGVRDAAAGKLVSMEVASLASDGAEHFFDFSLKPIFDEKGEITCLIQEARDITKRKQAEIALRASEHFVQTLMDAILSPIFSKDTAGRYQSCNAAFEAYLGLNRSEILGKTAYDIAPPELAQKYHEMDMDLIRQGGAQIYESKVRYADGSLHDVIFNKTTYKNADGSLGGIVGIIVDISDRKRSEEALRHSQQTLRKAQETAHLGIWEWNIRQNSLHWTDELYRIHGIDPGEAFSLEPGFMMVYRDDRGKCREYMNSVMAGGQIPFIEYRIVRPSGEVRHIYASAELIRGADGEPEMVVGIAYDITEHKKLEEQLRQAQKMEAIGTLAGGIAHDFNNILTAIIGYGSILKMRMEPDNPLRSYAEEILGASERAANLTGSLLAFSRKQTINLRPVSLNEIIKGVSKLLKRVIGEDVEFQTNLCSEALVVLADNGQIEQVLMNLATNARDSMPDGGLLSITTERVEVGGSHGYIQPGIYAVITVSDTGEGMDEATRLRIFEPFFTTKELGKGTGLGLSMVYGIVKQHDGEINVYSEPGGGTVFRIYLKLLHADTEKSVTESLPAPVPGTETILLAEDDDGVRTFFRNVLEEYGYRVLTAVDGEDAIACYLANRDSIQLLLFDLIMPKKNGKEAYNEIVRAGGGDLPVIFSSGYSADIINKRGGVEDCINLISKPISPYLLLSRIRGVLDGREPVRPVASGEDAGRPERPHD